MAVILVSSVPRWHMARALESDRVRLDGAMCVICLMFNVVRE